MAPTEPEPVALQDEIGHFLILPKPAHSADFRVPGGTRLEAEQVFGPAAGDRGPVERMLRNRTVGSSCGVTFIAMATGDLA